MSDYKKIFEQVEQAKLAEQASSSPPPSPLPQPEPPASPPEKTVNLCVRVPESWHYDLKSLALQQRRRLQDLVFSVLDDYLQQHRQP